MLQEDIEVKALKLRRVPFTTALLYDKELSDREKITMSAIGALCEMSAEVNGIFSTQASTRTLTIMTVKSKRTLLRTLNRLRDKGYISLKYYAEAEYYKNFREIFLTDKGLYTMFNIKRKKK